MLPDILRRLLIGIGLLATLAPAAWAIDPTTVTVNTPAGPLTTTVTQGSWSYDSATGKASGSGTQTVAFAGQSYTLNAVWTGVFFDVPTSTLTSGTIALDFATGPAVASVGIDVNLVSLSLDAATGTTTITGGEIHAPATDGGLGLNLPSSIDLAGTTIVFSPAGLIYLASTVPVPISILGVKLSAGASLQVDLSDLAAAPSGAIPPARIGSPVDGGVAWRGFQLAGATVAFGASTPSAGTAALTYLTVGWPGPTSTAPEYRGEATASVAAPLHGVVLGAIIELTSGTLKFDSTMGARAVSGSFGGTITLPGSQGGSSSTVGPNEASVAYGAPFDFQLVIEHTFPTPVGVTVSGLAAHVKHVGMDASKTEALPSATALTTTEQAPSWTGFVIFEGDLAVGLPWAAPGGTIELDVKNLVAPVPLTFTGLDPWMLSGWLGLKHDATLATVGGSTVQVTRLPPTGVAALGGAPSVLSGTTCIRFVSGLIDAGFLYGRITLPDATPLPFGAALDAGGGLLAAVSAPAIEFGSGPHKLKLAPTTAYLDLTKSKTPPLPGAPTDLTWTGLFLTPTTLTLPAPFHAVGGGDAIVAVPSLAWGDGGLLVAISLASTPMSVLGVTLGGTSTLVIDLSSTLSATAAVIPPGRMGSPTDGGVPWRGIYLTDATVAFGHTAPLAGAATLTYLSVGWSGPSTSTAPEFQGELTASLAKPFHGAALGFTADLTSGTLNFDSSHASGSVVGSFGGSLHLPASQGASTWTLGPNDLTVSYDAPYDFEFVLEHTFTTPLEFAAGAFTAHAMRVGVDASTKAALPSAASLTAAEQAASWTGLVVFDGDLSLPVPGAHDGSVLSLALNDVVIPAARPDEFSGWLMLQGATSSTIASIGDLKIKVTNTPQPPLTGPVAPPNFDPATVPSAVAGTTYFHFEAGNLVSGCLYGLLKIPGVLNEVGFGATVDAGGDLVADLAISEIKIGQGDSEVVFRNVQATLDLSQSGSPPQAPSPQWTGLVLRTMDVTLPWPFKTSTVITATNLLWDHGLSGTISLSAADAGTVIVISDTDRFKAHLTSLSMSFASGAVDGVTAAGILTAKPFLDAVTFTVEYDAAKGFVLEADSDAGIHVFGGTSTSNTSLLNLTFTTLAIEIPSKSASQNGGALSALRMDGSVNVAAQGVSAKAFSFEDIRLRSDGTIDRGGAWIDLRDHGHWEFQKFAVDVREIGCGSMPGANGTNQVWLGISGGLALSDMWGMSVDVQANKFRWFEDHGFAVEEISVNATVKQTVHIEGKVKYVSDATKREFRGKLDAKISVASGSFQAGIQFVSGHEAAYSYWGVSGYFQLPAVGIPLGSTGLSLYGVNGGVSKHLTPNGVDMYDWIPDVQSGFAFQAGVTIGTTSDTGYTLHAGVTMTVLIDPLIIRIDGTGVLLTAMSDVANMDRVVKASLVYDSTTSTFEAKLELGQSDSQPFQFPHLASVRGMAVMHIDPHKAFLHVGTKASPVTARLFPDVGGGITASSWFMIDWTGPPSTFSIFVGAYVGWSFTKEFKVCDVTGEIAAGGEVAVTINPFAFSGSLSASIGAHACGFGFDLSANCTVTYPDIHLHAACTLEIDLCVKTVTLSADVDQP